ncbi:hypothetical protein, partial [Burkholderia contaminans]|uniref:hypothetical protein n=1 Tax=Burkholderia contaminans TaxID=488447 RepID=UPI001C963837
REPWRATPSVVSPRPAFHRRSAALQSVENIAPMAGGGGGGGPPPPAPRGARGGRLAGGGGGPGGPPPPPPATPASCIG